MGGFIVTPLLLDEVFGLSLTKVGLVSLVRPATFAVAAPVAGWLAVRWGERSMGLTGAFLITASMLTFASVSAAAGLLAVFLALALSGVGMGATSPAMAATIANAVRDEDLGLAGAAQQMVSTLGTATGTQVLFTVQQAREGSGLAASFHAAYLVGALAAIIAVAMAAFVRSTPRAASLAVVREEAESAVA
jgi:MFS family permease